MPNAPSTSCDGASRRGPRWRRPTRRTWRAPSAAAVWPSRRPPGSGKPSTAIFEARGDYDLDFLATWPALEARDWLTRIPGIGPKTASVVLLFCYGLPLMPIDTHVERVSRRIGLIRPAADVVRSHDDVLRDIPAARVYEAHVNLITHGRRTCHARHPACERCPVAPRCRYVDPRAA